VFPETFEARDITQYTKLVTESRTAENTKQRFRAERNLAKWHTNSERISIQLARLEHNIKRLWQDKYILNIKVEELEEKLANVAAVFEHDEDWSGECA